MKAWNVELCFIINNQLIEINQKTLIVILKPTDWSAWCWGALWPPGLRVPCLNSWAQKESDDELISWIRAGKTLQWTEPWFLQDQGGETCLTCCQYQGAQIPYRLHLHSRRKGSKMQRLCTRESVLQQTGSGDAAGSHMVPLQAVKFSTQEAAWKYS